MISKDSNWGVYQKRKSGSKQYKIAKIKQHKIEWFYKQIEAIRNDRINPSEKRGIERIDFGTRVGAGEGLQRWRSDGTMEGRAEFSTSLNGGSGELSDGHAQTGH